MSNYHSDNGGSGSRTTLIIVGIIGGVVLVFLMVCGGLVYLGIRAFKETMEPLVEGVKEMAESQAVANQFLENIRANRLDAAYQSTTEGFQKGMSRKAFDELVQKHPELKQPAFSLEFDPRQGAAQPQGQAQIKPFSGPYHFRSVALGKRDKESGEFTITVAKENGVLKVDELTLFKAEGSKPEGSKPEASKPEGSKPGDSK
jgi:hypothetical protein